MTLLSAEDKYYLRGNLFMAPLGSLDDPQAQRVYAVEQNVIDVESPVWTFERIRSEVDALDEEYGLRVKIIFTDEPGYSATEEPDGGVIQLRRKGAPSEYRPLRPGLFLASIVVHEFAHLITPQVCHPGIQYGAPGFESHGPQFVRCYLDLLSRCMDTRKPEEAFAFMGVAVGEKR